MTIQATLDDTIADTKYQAALLFQLWSMQNYVLINFSQYLKTNTMPLALIQNFASCSVFALSTFCVSTVKVWCQLMGPKIGQEIFQHRPYLRSVARPLKCMSAIVSSRGTIHQNFMPLSQSYIGGRCCPKSL